MRITSYENLDNALGFKQVEMPRRLLLGINHLRGLLWVRVRVPVVLVVRPYCDVESLLLW